MQEIEIKFQVDNLEIIKSKLTSLGCELSNEIIQKDTVFLPDLDDKECSEGKIFIRIRETNGKSELTLKKRSKVAIHSNEIELEISDYFLMYDFLNTLGIKEWVTVEKTRVNAEYKGFNICMDEVKRLGQFIEIEIVTEDANNPEHYEKEILNLCKELGVDTNLRIDSHYDTMIDELNKKTS